jgi:glycosyltransferase involved in cell wall biosynthesis
MSMFRQVILVLDHAFISGGAAKVALASGLELARRGMDVHVLAAIGPVDPDLGAAGIKVTCLEQRGILDVSKGNRIGAAIQGIWNAKARSAMDAILRGCSTAETVVHFHQWSQALSPSVFAASNIGKFATVVTHQTFFATCPNGGYYNYPSQHICHYRPMSMSCLTTNCDARSRGHKAWRLIRQVVQDNLKYSPIRLNRIFTCDFAADVQGPHLQPCEKSYVLGNMIDIEKMPRVPCETSDEYVFVGRLSSEKGVEMLAHVGADLGLKLTFIGDGEKREAIKQIYPAAEITGWLYNEPHPERIVKRLRQARALVFPSVWYEIQPLVPLEAMALGVPAVVGDGGSARTSVEPGVDGLWFKHGDAQDLRRAVLQLKDDELVRRLSENAYQHYWERPATVARHVDGLLDIYDDLLRSHATRH